MRTLAGAAWLANVAATKAAPASKRRMTRGRGDRESRRLGDIGESRIARAKCGRASSLATREFRELGARGVGGQRQVFAVAHHEFLPLTAEHEADELGGARVEFLARLERDPK